MSADDARGPIDLAAVAEDDAWVEALLCDEHDPGDDLAVALSRWSSEVRAPAPEARRPVVPARPATSWRRPRGARLVGLVASVGLIFATGVGQAVARDPAAPLRFVVDRGVSLGERLVGQAPSDDGAAPAAPGTAREGSQSSRAGGARPGLPGTGDDTSGETRGGDGSSDGPRPLGPSLLSPSPRTTDPTPAPDRDDATVPPRPTPLLPAGSSAPPSPVPRPQETPSPTADTPSTTPSPTPTRKPQQGVRPRPRPPSSGAAPSPVPTQDPADPSEPSAPPADDKPTESSTSPTDEPSSGETGSGG